MVGATRGSASSGARGRFNRPMMSDGQLDFNDLRPRTVPVDELERRTLIHERAKRIAWQAIAETVEEALAATDLAPGDRACLERAWASARQAGALPPVRHLRTARQDQAV